MIIEALALGLFAVATSGAFMSFFPQWAPGNKTLAVIYRLWSSIPFVLGVFGLGMILLFIFG